MYYSYVENRLICAKWPYPCNPGIRLFCADKAICANSDMVSVFEISRQQTHSCKEVRLTHLVIHSLALKNSTFSFICTTLVLSHIRFFPQPQSRSHPSLKRTDHPTFTCWKKPMNHPKDPSKDKSLFVPQIFSKVSSTHFIQGSQACQRALNNRPWQYWWKWTLKKPHLPSIFLYVL
jgi:hypothetical protein